MIAAHRQVSPVVQRKLAIEHASNVDRALLDATSMTNKLYLLAGTALLASCTVDPESVAMTESELQCYDCDTDPPPPPEEGPPGGGGGGGGGTTLETLVDRCVGDVIIARNYDDPFSFLITGLALVRDPNGETAWSEPMPYHGGEYIRWYCSLAPSRVLGPSTWRLGGGWAGNGCPSGFDNGPMVCSSKTYIGNYTPTGWTAERSRCASTAANRIQARLGPNRLLEIRCVQ